MTTNNTNIKQISVPTACLSLIGREIKKSLPVSFCVVQKFTQSYSNCANFNTVKNSMETEYKNEYNLNRIQKKLKRESATNFRLLNKYFKIVL
jgi:hypothetical protein